MELDSHGLKFWRHYATLLKRIRVLSEADIHALAAAAQWWSVYQRAMEGLKNGLTQVTEANGEVAKPSVGIAKQAFSQCWAIMSAFGLNPIEQSCEQFRRTLMMIRPGNFSHEGFSHERRRFRDLSELDGTGIRLCYGLTASLAKDDANKLMIVLADVFKKEYEARIGKIPSDTNRRRKDRFRGIQTRRASQRICAFRQSRLCISGRRPQIVRGALLNNS